VDALKLGNRCQWHGIGVTSEIGLRA
jgi:hypothetical protein